MVVEPLSYVPPSVRQRCPAERQFYLFCSSNAIDAVTEMCCVLAIPSDWHVLPSHPMPVRC